MSRQSARDQALTALYAADLKGTAPDTVGLSTRATGYVNGTWNQRAEIDAAISAVATGWRIERMPPIDRNIIRLAVFELRRGDTPVGVVVSEAVKMAKRFSTERSGAFVNGVIAKLLDH